jgi:hypothetical protein
MSWMWTRSRARLVQTREQLEVPTTGYLRWDLSALDWHHPPAINEYADNPYGAPAGIGCS